MQGSDFASRDTIDRVKQILRVDLRLGEEREISDDQPLAGGSLGLDSLDILLLVSSIEKAFGVKVPNEELDASAFETVRSLSTFIDRRRGLQGGHANGH